MSEPKIAEQAINKSNGDIAAMSATKAISVAPHNVALSYAAGIPIINP
jgi:hypothetical protein